jgi:hypothetical protein
MPRKHWSRVKDDLRGVMDEVESTHPKCRFFLLTGLAEGADQLAATVALERGWKLRALLPFHRTCYEADFANARSVKQFRALLGASSEIEEPDRQTYARNRRDEGYSRVGEMLVSSSHLLLVVWDGKPSKGIGGSVEVMKAARAKNIPVCWVHATKSRDPVWLGSR